MIKFVDDQIHDLIIELFSYCKEYRVDYDFYDLDSMEDYGDEEILVDYESEVIIELPYTGEGYALTLGECFEAIAEVQKASIIDNYKYFSSEHVLIRVNSKNIERIQAYRNLSPYSFETTLSINEQIIQFDLVEGLTNFALLITQMDNYDKHSPPIYYDDLFIEMRSESEIVIDKIIIDELVQSYIYELSTSYEIDLFISPRVDYWGGEECELTEAEEKRRLRPLLRGRGINDVLTIFNSAAQIDDPEFLILSYTKVIEFVSQTVVKKELLDTVLNKLDSPRALSPDADYVLELEKTFEDLGNYKKDKEAIRLTIETCCDLVEIIKISSIPAHLKSFAKITINSSKDEKKHALNELAMSVSDTRNKIAHAKTNYRVKGNECPSDQLEPFAKCLKVVSSQVIRWFLRQHENSRIIR